MSVCVMYVENFVLLNILVTGLTDFVRVSIIRSGSKNLVWKSWSLMKFSKVTLRNKRFKKMQKIVDFQKTKIFSNIFIHFQVKSFLIKKDDFLKNIV